MFTKPWSVVDRKIGWGIALCGLAVALVNAGAFAQQARGFDNWWLALALAVTVLQLFTALGWSRLPPIVLRAIWIAQPPILLLALLLVFLAWHGGVHPPAPVVWLLDATVLATMALVVRLFWVLLMTLLLAASVPLSALIFLGSIPDLVLSWGFWHCANVIFVMLPLVLRHQMDHPYRTQETAAQLRAEEERIRAESADFDLFARTVHDEVLSTFAAALQFTGDPPPLLRRSAATARQELQRGAHGRSAEPLELSNDDAARLILDLIASAARGIEMSTRVLDGTVPSAAASALGLAAAEAGRNAFRHAGGGAGFLVLGDGSIQVSIVDAGAGFDLSAVAMEHFGIRDSIIRRIEELQGGRVTLDSGPGGTTVVMRWTRPFA